MEEYIDFEVHEDGEVGINNVNNELDDEEDVNNNEDELVNNVNNELDDEEDVNNNGDELVNSVNNDNDNVNKYDEILNEPVIDHAVTDEDSAESTLSHSELESNAEELSLVTGCGKVRVRRPTVPSVPSYAAEDIPVNNGSGGSTCENQTRGRRCVRVRGGPGQARRCGRP